MTNQPAGTPGITYGFYTLNLMMMNVGVFYSQITMNSGQDDGDVDLGQGHSLQSQSFQQPPNIEIMMLYTHLVKSMMVFSPLFIDQRKTYNYYGTLSFTSNKLYDDFGKEASKNFTEMSQKIESMVSTFSLHFQGICSHFIWYFLVPRFQNIHSTDLAYL